MKIALAMAIEALEKAEARKPAEKDADAKYYGYNICPCCGDIVRQSSNWCICCGQHIDWT